MVAAGGDRDRQCVRVYLFGDFTRLQHDLDVGGRREPRKLLPPDFRCDREERALGELTQVRIRMVEQRDEGRCMRRSRGAGGMDRPGERVPRIITKQGRQVVRMFLRCPHPGREAEAQLPLHGGRHRWIGGDDPFGERMVGAQRRMQRDGGPATCLDRAVADDDRLQSCHDR
ncbi:hypothetical protein P873_11945 [Arenimonas composti TR7-09 = DSM 18010]|uniref:Uncharacterized protein n=1 Tax=Arenimonas composti TR7-09 = DSM 18010 TaxID=1121013 RepID=A0A091BXS4_9GAMM|nr:hypothetical protein P873_11945 [Arenimonas composti TR7-09 = DSM 18010]